MSRTKAIAGTNLEQARSHNRRVVIEAIRINGALSRAAIARHTALTTQTVSNIVEELEKAELLRAEPTTKGTRGQPAVPYSINPDGGYSIGLQLDHQLLVGVVTDLSGTVRSRIEQPVDRPTPVEAMPVLAKMPKNLMRDFRFDRARLLGIGMSMPGPFGVEGMTSVGPTALPGWQDFPLDSELQRLTGIDVTVENDANLAALGEHWRGEAQARDDLAVLLAGERFGSGVRVERRRVLPDVEAAVVLDQLEAGHRERVADAVVEPQPVEHVLDAGLDVDEQVEPALLHGQPPAERVALQIAHRAGLAHRVGGEALHVGHLDREVELQELRSVAARLGAAGEVGLPEGDMAQHLLGEANA